MPSRMHNLSEFGGRKALALSLWHRALGSIGAYDAAQTSLSLGRVRRLVFVCKGNICRSAYGHAYAAQRHSVAVTSAGLEADRNGPPDPVARACARQRGYGMETHASQPMADLQLTSADLILAFEPAHAQLLRERYAKTADAQVALLGCFGAPRWPHLHDPYGLGMPYFNTCFERIERAIDALLPDWQRARHDDEA